MLRSTPAARSGRTIGYTYDANGNRLTQTGSQTATYTVSSSSNRMTSISGTPTRAYSYDATGNTTGDGVRTFTFTDAGRLSSVTQAGVTTAYIYNAFGQRVQKSNPSATRYFVYDEAGNLLGEYDASGALIQETVWLGSTPVATLRPNGAGVSVYYVHTDHLNTPRRITRPSDNVIVWRWDTDPFGNTTAAEDPDGDSVAFEYGLRFAGQYFDGETGTHYNYFRDYDPYTGRYLESDPIGLSGGINTYAYVNGDPISMIDPEGLMGAGGIPNRPGTPPPGGLHFGGGGPDLLNVDPEVKKLVCKFVRECKGDMNCVYNELNALRNSKFWQNGPSNPQTWNDPVVRAAENFATAGSDAPQYPKSLVAHNSVGIWFYQYVWKPYILSPRETTPVSDDAYRAGMSGRYLYHEGRSKALEWCNQCESQ